MMKVLITTRIKVLCFLFHKAGFDRYVLIPAGFMQASFEENHIALVIMIKQDSGGHRAKSPFSFSQRSHGAFALLVPRPISSDHTEYTHDTTCHTVVCAPLRGRGCARSLVRPL